MASRPGAGSSPELDVARKVARWIRTTRLETANGVTWPADPAKPTTVGTDLYNGTPGVVLFHLALLHATGDRSSLDEAWAGASELAAQLPAIDTSADCGLYTGLAGAAFVLEELHRATGERSFLDAAMAGTMYLQAVGSHDKDGFKVFHHEPGGEELFYLSWCHGPAGTSRLFYRLADVTQDAHWHEMVRRAARGTIATGLPEQRSAGFWNNISQCCGNSGVGEYFLSLQRLMPDPAYAGMVRRVAADTLRRATTLATPEGDGIKWIQAENRVQPEVLIAQTGYMQRASGVATLFLHMDAAAPRKPVPIAWPDSPFI